MAGVSTFGNLQGLRAAFVIRKAYGEMILDGSKTLEVGGCAMKEHRGEAVGIAFSGTNHVFGEAVFGESCQITNEQYKSPDFRCQHKIPEGQLDDFRYNRIYATPILRALEYPVPVELKYTPGAVRWLNLEANETFQANVAKVQPAICVATGRKVPHIVEAMPNAGQVPGARRGDFARLVRQMIASGALREAIDQRLREMGARKNVRWNLLHKLPRAVARKPTLWAETQRLRADGDTEQAIKRKLRDQYSGSLFTRVLKRPASWRPMEKQPKDPECKEVQKPTTKQVAKAIPKREPDAADFVRSVYNGSLQNRYAVWQREVASEDQGLHSYAPAAAGHHGPAIATAGAPRSPDTPGLGDVDYGQSVRSPIAICQPEVTLSPQVWTDDSDGTEGDEASDSSCRRVGVSSPPG